jgi:Spy/CpxP family protein refolding chaperone
MLFRRSANTVALAAALCAACTIAFAADDSKYPEWRGQWRRPPGIGVQWDPTKALGPAQQAPLTPEYQKVFEASMADQRVRAATRPIPASRPACRAP